MFQAAHTVHIISDMICDDEDCQSGSSRAGLFWNEKEREWLDAMANHGDECDHGDHQSWKDHHVHLPQNTKVRHQADVIFIINRMACIILISNILIVNA